MHEEWVRVGLGDFYLLIGTAGLTLTGHSSSASLGHRIIAARATTGIARFVSPNAVYFSTTLVVAAVLLVPDLPPMAIGVFLSVSASGSLCYGIHQGAPALAAKQTSCDGLVGSSRFRQRLLSAPRVGMVSCFRPPYPCMGWRSLSPLARRQVKPGTSLSGWLSTRTSSAT
jgi:hypothetical protein